MLLPLLIPFRVKNPPKHFPVATVTIIGLNVLVFALTSHGCLVVRKEVVDGYALRWGLSPLYTIFTSMFLHIDILHLAGNMLYLWIFGPAVEDRLRVPGFLGLYLLTGFAADVAHATLGAVSGATVPLLGASGCIMGILGAYWYLFSWSTVCVFYFFWILFRVWYGVVEVAALWVIGIYFLMDLANGIFGRLADVAGGVANFAHVGGVVAGAVIVWALRFKRDTSEVSQVRAIQADVKRLESLTLKEMRPLILASPDDDDLVSTFANKALDEGSAEDIQLALQANMRGLLLHCPQVVSHYIAVLKGSPDAFSPADILLVGRWCESNDRPDHALAIYAEIESRHAESRELEMALFRSAHIYWTLRNDPRSALSKLEALFSRFPAGMTLFEAEDLRDDILRKMQQAA